MNQKAIITITISVLIALLLGAWAGFMVGVKQGAVSSIDSFSECANAGYAVQESSPRRCAVPGGQTFTEIIETEPISLEGRVVCLPHKNMDEPHTLECAIGFVTDSGEYYALRSEASDLTGAAGSDRRVVVSGTLKEEESTKYQSIGTITVTSFEFR